MKAWDYMVIRYILCVFIELFRIILLLYYLPTFTVNDLLQESGRMIRNDLRPTKYSDLNAAHHIAAPLSTILEEVVVFSMVIFYSGTFLYSIKRENDILTQLSL